MITNNGTDPGAALRTIEVFNVLNGHGLELLMLHVNKA